MAAKPQDEDHPYGHERIETLSTFIIGAILVYAALRIGLHAGQTIYSHETSSPKPIAIVAAAISLISKEILFRYTLKVGRRIRSESVIANAWHHRSDAFSSVATLVGVTSAVFIPSLRILDPYAALIVAFIIVKVGTEISWKAAKEIVDTAPHEEERRMIEDVIRGMDDVLLVHDLKTRYFGRYILADVHIEVAPDITVEEGHNIATKVKEEVLAAVPIMMNLLVHVEPAGDYESRHRP
jgi:cation diffusion facilitator family transporter